jgi:hypothetical protein
MLATVEVHEKAMKLIITRKGHLGLAPCNVSVGDQVTILATGYAPFYIRKVGKQDNRDSYVLLGSGYVDGMTHASRFQNLSILISDLQVSCTAKLPVSGQETFTR